jgi:hypothetical protein
MQACPRTETAILGILIGGGILAITAVIAVRLASTALAIASTVQSIGPPSAS